MTEGSPSRTGVRRLGAARAGRPIEWPTLLLLAGVHATWAALLWWGDAIPPLAALLILGPILTLHSSLQHEVLHGHPTADSRLNDAMVALPLGLLVPYRRFRDLHLAHHHDPNLTDPYDDPETNYLDPVHWARMGALWRLVWRANNTLLGRMALGPVLAQWTLIREDWRARHDPAVRSAWALHGVGVAVVLALVAASEVPLWAYLGGCWLAMSILRIRTFLEHRAAHAPRERSVIIEDRGPLALLFLNNNFHAVHHARPTLPWYRLPAAYAAERETVLRRNGGYRYTSYWPVFRDHLLRAKDPVPHPFWHSGNRTTARQDAAAVLSSILPEGAPPAAPQPARSRVERS
ncbi:fatty acid desaturase [Jannaschia seohaensis]|uniref:Fatty acid desaturase n=1 Tax=Jannaschia seohaensis TaxID=475081 RepID=A0A2Y9AY84_9RHOB|nr:fatty acid desaturase [Jannaschia seohaensis]PWJ17462.1 fatty acid desaturase [Jannaschia seohaensis]SSA47527.1 Fatty acid desaturase [Jannaschia seohaensis]